MRLVTKKVLTLWLSNTLDTSFFIEALAAMLFKYETPEINKTDQDSQ
jgi:hypothetical protein